jgi:aspartate carbamoyltransferase catalytic subunit
MKHLISVDDMPVYHIENIICLADDYKNNLRYGEIDRVLKNKILLTDFYAPSTRTRFSFEAAMNYLGGSVIGSENASEFSSVAKGESLYDNFRVISGYCDVIVGRFIHEGDAKIAADASLVPLINGGDGSGEHPTQALLDYFTIKEYHPTERNLVVTFLGDNLRGRTVHSLAKLLAIVKNVKTINFISHKKMTIPSHICEFLNDRGVYAELYCGMEHAIIKKTDVLYVTRTQTERDGINLSENEIKKYHMTQDLMNMLPENSIVLHPLPRNEELPSSLDNNPRAKWFEQAWNGLYVRMAILKYLCHPY